MKGGDRMTREKLIEVSKEVTRILAENRASITDVHRIFRDIELRLQVNYSDPVQSE